MNLEQKTITSMEVAEMMEINHFEILRKLEGNSKVVGIIPTMTDNKIVVSDYFVPGTYQDASGKENKCYLVTKLGCDFLANKFTGEKGILFSARYVKKFREMEETIQNGILDNLSTEMQALIMHDKKIQFVMQHIEDTEKRLIDVDQDLQNFKMDMPLLGLECDRIVSAVKAKGVECLGGKGSNAYADKSLRGRVYSDIYKQLKREFAVGSYKAIKRSQTDIAIEIVNSYKLSLALQEEIKDCNSQEKIGV